MSNCAKKTSKEYARDVVREIFADPAPTDAGVFTAEAIEAVHRGLQAAHLAGVKAGLEAAAKVARDSTESFEDWNMKDEACGADYVRVHIEHVDPTSVPR